MTLWLLCLLMNLPVPSVRQTAPPRFQKILRFSTYTFILKSADVDSGAAVTVAAYRGSLLLTRFTQPVDGVPTGAYVADLDANRFPELYVHSVREDGSIRRDIYGWQFLPERLATISPARWATPDPGYMGLDTLRLTKNALCRAFPLYTIAGGTARLTGNSRQICYRLRPTGQNYQLQPE